MFTILLLVVIAVLIGYIVNQKLQKNLDKALEDAFAYEPIDWDDALPSVDKTRIIELEEELKRAYASLEMVLNSTDPLACHNIEKENA